MYGPEIFVRSISKRAIKDSYGNVWQYQGRSDRHSKIACWGVLFDLMLVCPLLRDQISREVVGFGINHKLNDFVTGKVKALDLLICTSSGEPLKGVRKKYPTFASLIPKYDVVLSPAEEDLLSSLPVFRCVSVGAVHVALEAKAVMTDMIGQLPRFHDELTSSHVTVHGHSDYAVAVGLAQTNASDTFISPDRNKYNLVKNPPTWSKDRQPDSLAALMQTLRDIRKRTTQHVPGFDAVGVIVVNFKNDGSPVRLVTDAPAPQPNDSMHYDQMIHRIRSLYEAKFQNV